MSIDEDYYKPIIVRGDFNGNYMQYESKGDKGKNLSIKKYLNMIKPYLSDIINNHKTCGLVRYHSRKKSWLEETSKMSEWKIQLTMAINFISSKDSDETRTMHTKSDNVEIMIGSETDETIEDLFDSFLQKYQVVYQNIKKENVYDSVDVLHNNLNKVSLSRGGLYIDSLKWLKTKRQQ